MNAQNTVGLTTRLIQSNSPIRLRLAHPASTLDGLVLVKHVSGQETLCGGIEYRLFCVSADAALPLKEFIALPAELQLVTDRGHLHSVCGIVAQASAGQSDGGLATYQLVVRDGLTLMAQRVNTRVFRGMNETDIAVALVSEWRSVNPVLAKTLEIDTSGLTGTYPAREFTMQHNESDAVFITRLLKRRGIAWFIRSNKTHQSASPSAPSHTLVLFDSPGALKQNAAGIHRKRQNEFC